MKTVSFRSVLLGLLLPLHCLAASVNLSVSPSTSLLAPGESTFIDLVAAYDGSDKLLGGAVSLSYRADLLEVLGIVLRAPSDVSGTTGTISVNGSDGMVSGIGFATFAGIGGSFTVATVEFRASGKGGDSPMTAVDAGDPVYAWVNEAFEMPDVTSTPGAISISAVPEPHRATILVAGLALLAIVAWGRRRFPSRRRPEL